MQQGVRIGRVAGITVRVNWSVAVVVVLIAQVLAVSVLPAALPHHRPAVYWTAAVVAAFLYLASLLAHEFAHALVARSKGVAVRSITLWMLGGVTEFEGEPVTAAADFWIALAGPLASLAAGGIFYGVGAAIHAAGGSPVASAAAAWLAVMNGILGVFNLLPGAPLDGGHVLRAVLWRYWGDEDRADQAAARAGQVLGVLVAALGIAETLSGGSLDGLWLVLIGWFLIAAAGAEGKAAAERAVLAGLRVADIMTPEPESAPGWSSVEELAHTAAGSGQEALPVVGTHGELTGIALTSQLAGIAREQRPRLRLDQVALAVPENYRAAPDDPAAPLVNRTPLGGEIDAVVLDNGRVTGVVTVSALEQAVRQRTLTSTRS